MGLGVIACICFVAFYLFLWGFCLFVVIILQLVVGSPHIVQHFEIDAIGYIHFIEPFHENNNVLILSQ